jgi:hypothetical protein
MAVKKCAEKIKEQVLERAICNAQTAIDVLVLRDEKVLRRMVLRSRWKHRAE